MAKGGAPSIARDARRKKFVDSGGESESSLPLIRDDLLASAKRVTHAEVDTVLQAEVLNTLLDGRRTLTELVEHIYDVGKDNPEYQMYYQRVRRATRNLSSKGLVSAGLIRRDTPYRITKYGVSKLVKIGDPAEEYRMVSRQDYAIFLGSLVMLLAIFLAVIDVWNLGSEALKVLYSCFFVVTGAGLMRLTQILRNIV